MFRRAAAFIFAALLCRVFAFIVNGCYNKGTKGNEAMISVIGTYKKPGVAAPGFFVYRKPHVRRGVPESLSDKEMIIKIPPLIK